MPNFFFTDAHGTKRGPLSPQQLKAMAMQGLITPNTTLETDNGKKGLAGQLSGLFNAPPQPATPTVNQTTPPNVPVPVVEGAGKSSWLITVIGLAAVLIVGGIGWAMITASSSSTKQEANRVRPPTQQQPQQQPAPIPPKVEVDVPNPVEPVPPQPKPAVQPNGQVPNPNPPVQQNQRPVPPVRYVDGHDFSDGVAWVRTHQQWQCIDKTGNIILQLNEREEPQSSFSQGVALVERSDRTVELIDKTGKVVSSPKSGEYDRITRFIRDIGMIFVHKHVDSYQLTENQIGIIDSSGGWLVHLMNDPILAVATRVDGGNSFSGPQYLPGYWGEGIFMTDQNFFNISTGNRRALSVDIGKPYIVTASHTITDVKAFENGLAVFEDGEAVYRIDKSGTPTAIFRNPGGSLFRNSRWGDLGRYSDGLFFLSGGNGQNAIASGFYDISGRQVIDLSEYRIRPGSYHSWDHVVFSDGYCVLNVSNPQYVGYYTVIDKTGKEMFEPRKSPSWTNSGGGTDYMDLTTRCGMIVIGTTIINATGEIVAEFEQGTNVSDYSEDMALVKDRGEIYYIDKTGKRLPMDNAQVPQINDEQIQPVVSPVVDVQVPPANNLKEELKKSGFGRLFDFVQFGGSTQIRDKFAQARQNVRGKDEWDRANALAEVAKIGEELKLAKKEFAKKVFFDEYHYSVDSVDIKDDVTSFTMSIRTEFTDRNPNPKVGNTMVFPVPSVSVVGGTSNDGYIWLKIHGSTESIKEFVRNSRNGDYQARIQFKNLESFSRTSRARTSAAQRDMKAIETLEADVLAIEIVKKVK